MENETVPLGVKGFMKLLLHMLRQGFKGGKVVTIGIELALRGEGSNDWMIWPQDTPSTGISDIWVSKFPLWKGRKKV